MTASDASFRYWVITAVGFTTEFLIWGSFYNFAMYITDIVDYFDSSYGFIGFCATTMSSLGFIFSPLAAEVVVHGSYGVAIFLMAVMFIVGFYTSSLTTQSWEFFFTYGILLGCCCTLNSIVFNYLVDNMDGNHDNVISVTTSAAGLGVIFFGCLSAYFMMDTSIDWQEAFQYIALMGFVLMAGAIVLALLDKSVHRFPFVGIPQISCVPVGLFGPEILTDTASDAAHNSDTELTRTPSNNTHVVTEGTPLLSVPPTTNQECCALTEANDVAEGQAAQLSGWQLFLSSDRRPLLLAITHGLIVFTAAMPIKLSVTYVQVISYTVNGRYDNNAYYYMVTAVGLGICISRMLMVAVQKLKGDSFGGMAQSKIMQVGTVLVCAVLASIPIGSMTIAGACIGLFLYCFFAGAYITLFVVRTIEVLGTHGHLYNVNLQFFWIGVIQPFGSYMVGSIYDNTGNFQYVWLTVAIFFGVSFLADLYFFPKITLQSLFHTD